MMHRTEVRCGRRGWEEWGGDQDDQVAVGSASAGVKDRLHESLRLHLGDAGELLDQLVFSRPVMANDWPGLRSIERFVCRVTIAGMNLPPRVVELPKSIVWTRSFTRTRSGPCRSGSGPSPDASSPGGRSCGSASPATVQRGRSRSRGTRRRRLDSRRRPTALRSRRRWRGG